jgi:[protein-PII] uridylyltransferase
VLTVADVRGTNPKLWNAWKARLFEEFYERTKRALRRGLETPGRSGRADPGNPGPERAGEDARDSRRRGSREVWSQWTDAYFLRYTPEEIAWQTTLLADRRPARRHCRWWRSGN